MSVTIESIAKWQPPSVLHLLPFSKNNAETSVPGNNNNMNNNMVSTPVNQQASYAQEVNHSNKGLPNISSGSGERAAREKPRSKSAAVMDNRIQLHKQQEQQQRLFRASSERLSRSPKKPSGPKGFIERARSEYVVKSDRKLTQEVVTFAIKDINEQILGNSGQNEIKSMDQEKFSPNENGRYKMKPLLKPVIKLHEGRWPQNNARFWRSSTISPGERELQRHKNSLDAQLSAFKRSKMVKLNVKDLPRSETPIGENDPDKLNMKQVIAFLQSSGDVRNVNDDIDNDKKRIKSSNSIMKTKSEHTKSVDKVNENSKDNSAALLIAAKSRKSKDESSDNTPNGADTKTETHSHHNHSNNKTDLNTHLDNSSKPEDNHNNLETIIKPRPSSYTGEISCQLRAEDKHHPQHQTDNNNDPRNARPKSLQFIRDSTEFRIPARIRQIRESTVDNRPFRLHRFLTLVSHTPDEETLSKRRVNGRLNANNSNHSSSPALNSNSGNTRSSFTLSKNKDDDIQGKTYTDTKGFFLTRNTPSRHDHQKKKEIIKRSKQTPSPNQNKNDSGDNIDNDNKIICLPIAPVDFDDSDDDTNFINLPTVPSKSTRKDLTLSAHGHAMLTKHFPQVETFQKATIRPHSEKIRLKQRLEINDSIKVRPSTVKPNDLVEWAGVQNPERIFLTDTSDHDPTSDRTTAKSTSHNQNTTTSTHKEELPSNCLKESNKLESPHRSETIDSANRKKSLNSSTKIKGNDDVTLFPADNSSTDASSDNSRDAVVGTVRNVCKTSSGAKPKAESVSPPLSDPVRLTLRKERNLTREKSYMVDMKGNDVYFGQSKYTVKDNVI